MPASSSIAERTMHLGMLPPQSIATAAHAVRLKQEHLHTIAWMVAGVFVAGAILMSARLIRGHMKHFTVPMEQSKIVGILWMIPVYAADSWLSLRFKDAALYLDLIRDSYEGYVIYLFLALMISYLGNGDERKVLQILSTLPEMPHPWPMRWIAKPIQMGPVFLHDCKLATMQFVVLKPLMAFVAIVLEIYGLYDQGNFSMLKGYLYISLVLNASITYAFYYLVLFYLALHHDLAPYNPVPKFLCIKAVLFLSFWQSVVLAFLARFDFFHQTASWSVENIKTGIQNLLICVEMCLVAIAHQRAFPYDPYIGRFPAAHRTSLLADHLALEDAMRDFNEVMPVVLPSAFTPAASVVRGTRYSRKFETSYAEQVGLLSEDHDVPEDIDAEAQQRGWRL